PPQRPGELDVVDRPAVRRDEAERVGEAWMVTVEGFDDGRAVEAARTQGADVAVVDLPLEEIFIAYGREERSL
ncbi:MAG: hypothetical protein ACF8XB_25275, partial [Planctomycetota bacterium JB042]